MVCLAHNSTRKYLSPIDGKYVSFNEKLVLYSVLVVLFILPGTVSEL